MAKKKGKKKAASGATLKSGVVMSALIRTREQANELAYASDDAGYALEKVYQDRNGCVIADANGCDDAKAVLCQSKADCQALIDYLTQCLPQCK